MGGDRAIVAQRITKIIGLPDVHVDAEDIWMPAPMLKADGEWDLRSIAEANLADANGESKRFLSPEQREKITDWWLAARERPMTPNWDIASRCTVGSKSGLLLVEAKAHHAELKEDGKPLGKDASEGSKKNHERIGKAICEASSGLEKAMHGWNLRCDSHYQLANRFAWAWKLASMGVPVVLVYLGFQNAKEMSDHGEPFVDCADWSRVMLGHSRNIVPERAWGRELKIGDSTIKPLIRIWKQELTATA